VDLEHWIDAYLDHLRVERALARNTLDSYARDLNALAAHAGGDGDP
jgi:integrase/recombinase XerD